MVTAVCPECGYTVNLGAQPYEGQRVICAGCGANLEVISLGHLELDWVYDTPHHNPEEERECKEIWEKEIVGGVIAGE
jgi:lysine biosynthesis protein LysW